MSDQAISAIDSDGQLAGFAAIKNHDTFFCKSNNGYLL